MTVGDALHIVLKCANGLGHAHGRRIVHRDVKPENIMITQMGEVKITDLGLAKPTDQDPGLTDSGTGVGTPRYMAPEQARSGKNADPRCDIYALGCTLYELVTATVAFLRRESSLDLMAKSNGHFTPGGGRLNRDVPPPRPHARQMLAKDPRFRYQSCPI